MLESATRMTYRAFGDTGERVSAIGLGGFHLGIPEDPGVAREIVRRAIHGGVTFMDNCWDYHLGESEVRMGHALRDGYREQVFLMTKLDSHSRDGALRQFEQSLNRLETTWVDLLQIHEVIREDDPQALLRPGGAIETYLELKAQGAARFIGFTGHKDPSIHRSMIEVALAEGIRIDAVQMPVNAFDASFKSFTREVLPLCLEHGIAVIGMKSLGAGRLLGRSSLEAADLLRWSLSQKVSTLVTGCECVRDVDQAIEAAAGFTPLEQVELDRMEALARAAAEIGSPEGYKTGSEFDGTLQNPEWTA